MQRAREALGHPIEIISGIEEARLIYAGVANTTPNEPGRRLVVDIGGGSTEVIIGEQGKVTGTVAAERVIVRGKISGVIRGMTVALQASARVEGDIHHMSLAIEQGAEFDGRCRRPQDPSELKLDLEGMSNGQLR